MPILASMYAVLAVIAIIWGCYANAQIEEPTWRIGVEAIAGIATLLLYAGYWAPSLVNPLGVLAPCLFGFSVVWTVYHTRIVLRKVQPRGLSPEGRKMVRNGTIGLMLVFNFPAYWFGGIAALKAVI